MEFEPVPSEQHRNTLVWWCVHPSSAPPHRICLEHYILHFSPEDGYSTLLAKRWLLLTSPHGDQTQNNVIRPVIAVKILNLKWQVTNETDNMQWTTYELQNFLHLSQNHHSEIWRILDTVTSDEGSFTVNREDFFCILDLLSLSSASLSLS
jgi:hypothetical protein